MGFDEERDKKNRKRKTETKLLQISRGRGVKREGRGLGRKQEARFTT